MNKQDRPSWPAPNVVDDPVGRHDPELDPPSAPRAPHAPEDSTVGGGRVESTDRYPYLRARASAAKGASEVIPRRLPWTAWVDYSATTCAPLMHPLRRMHGASRFPLASPPTSPQSPSRTPTRSSRRAIDPRGPKGQARNGGTKTAAYPACVATAVCARQDVRRIMRERRRRPSFWRAPRSETKLLGAGAPFLRFFRLLLFEESRFGVAGLE